MYIWFNLQLAHPGDQPKSHTYSLYLQRSLSWARTSEIFIFFSTHYGYSLPSHIPIGNPRPSLESPVGGAYKGWLPKMQQENWSSFRRRCPWETWNPRICWTELLESKEGAGAKKQKCFQICLRLIIIHHFLKAKVVLSDICNINSRRSMHEVLTLFWETCEGTLFGV